MLFNQNKPVMKRTLTIRLFLPLIFLISCQKEENNPLKVTGSLSISIGLFISVNEVDNNLKSSLDAADFKVTIYNAAGVTIRVFESASEMPEEIELESGQYYVTAHSDNNTPAAFDNPYYFGKSDVFSISPGGQQSIGVNCELANTMITIVYSDIIKNNYSDYSTIVSSTVGSLTFIKDEIRAGYFQPLPLNISASLTWQKDDGSYATRTLTGTIPSPQPKKHYEIHINASEAGGSAILAINLDETTVPVEIVQITGETVVPGIYSNGDLLITEIMYDPTSLTDAIGEWFEIYNNTNLPANLKQVVIRRNDADIHIIGSDVTLASHDYFVLARTDGAITGNKYVYGTSLSLTNSDGTLSLYNYGTDGTDGSLICSINYGGEIFPNATGASICLSPQLLNASDAVSGNSWCVSTTAYNTGDLGTPGIINNSCP